MIPIDKIIAVDKMQRYIEEHLQEQITMHDLAICTAYSSFHATKIFKDLLGITPYEYIRKLRLSKAAVELWDNDKRVLDTAINYVFDSHEGFTRAFSKQFGLTPSQYKKETPCIQLFKPNPVRDHYRLLQGSDPIDNKKEITKTYFTHVIEFPKRKLIYKPSYSNANNYFDYVSDIGCDVWGILCSIKEALYEPIGLWFPKSLKPEGCSEYVQGVEVPLSYDKEIPKDFEIIELPACSMMVFQGAPYEDELYDYAISYLDQEITKYNPTLYGYQWDDEAGPTFQMEPYGYRGYIEARPVKRL